MTTPFVTIFFPRCTTLAAVREWWHDREQPIFLARIVRSGKGKRVRYAIESFVLLRCERT